MNPLTMPTYYSTLFSTFKSLLVQEHLDELDRKIKEVENWMSDDLNPMTLNEAEIRMWQNMDLYSGFERGGEMITQMDINAKLEEIKSWLEQLFWMYFPHIRFTVPIKIM